MESGIKRNGYGLDDYFNVVEKPYWKYRMEFEEFDLNARNTMKVFSILEKVTFLKLIIPEFQKDPFKMELKEFAAYYDEIEEKYLKTDERLFNKFDLMPKADIVIHAKLKKQFVEIPLRNMDNIPIDDELNEERKNSGYDRNVSLIHSVYVSPAKNNQSDVFESIGVPAEDIKESLPAKPEKRQVAEAQVNFDNSSEPIVMASTYELSPKRISVEDPMNGSKTSPEPEIISPKSFKSKKEHSKIPKKKDNGK